MKADDSNFMASELNLDLWKNRQVRKTHLFASNTCNYDILQLSIPFRDQNDVGLLGGRVIAAKKEPNVYKQELPKCMYMYV